MLDTIFGKKAGKVRQWITIAMVILSGFSIPGLIGFIYRLPDGFSEAWENKVLIDGIIVLYSSVLFAVLCGTYAALYANKYRNLCKGVEQKRSLLKSNVSPSKEKGGKLGFDKTPKGMILYSEDPAEKILEILRGEDRDSNGQWWREMRSKYSRSPYKGRPEFNPVRLHLIDICKKFDKKREIVW